MGPGQLASAAPTQQALASRTLEIEQHQLHIRAEFNVSAKVLSKRRYRWDRLTPLVPWDFALGWGELSDETVLKRTSVSQGDRFMFWHLQDSGLNLKMVETSSANMHLIPANETILQLMQSIPVGAIIRLRGKLVDLQLANGAIVPTSLTRQDTGAGACEIVYVESIQVLHGMETTSA